MEFGHDHDIQEIPDLSQNFLRWYHSNEHYPNCIISHFVRQQAKSKQRMCFLISILSASSKTNYSWCAGWIKSADVWWLKNPPCIIRNTKRPVLASSDVVERSVPTVFDTPVVACGHIKYSVNHLYISIYFHLKTNSLWQCHSTKLKNRCMGSSAASMHTPKHTVVPNFYELCCRYQSQKRGVASKTSNNKKWAGPTMLSVRSHQPWPANPLCHRHLHLRRRGPELGKDFSDKPWLHSTSI